MLLTINGDERSVDANTVSDLLALFRLNERIIVVEHNGEIIARDSYPAATLNEGDVLEIVQMSAGG